MSENHASEMGKKLVNYQHIARASVTYRWFIIRYSCYFLFWMCDS